MHPIPSSRLGRVQDCDQRWARAQAPCRSAGTPSSARAHDVSRHSPTMKGAPAPGTGRDAWLSSKMSGRGEPLPLVTRGSHSIALNETRSSTTVAGEPAGRGLAGGRPSVVSGWSRTSTRVWKKRESAAREVMHALSAKLTAAGKDQRQQRDVGVIGLKTIVSVFL